MNVYPVDSAIGFHDTYCLSVLNSNKRHFEPIVSKTMEYKILLSFGICWIHFTSQVGMAGLASGCTSPFVMSPPGTSAAPMVITGAPTSTGPGKEPNTFCLWLIG